MRIAALAGGVGGAKLVDGLAQKLPPQELTVIVNTGDDFTHYGLRICPDIDTVCYTLAGLASTEMGWGRVNETWQVMQSLRDLLGPTWFNLGDHDLGTHLERTRRLQAGERLSQVTLAFCQTWGVKVNVLPMSDDPIPTQVITQSEGEIPFQEYFVHRQCQPQVRGFRFAGVEKAHPAPGVIESLLDADVIIICPSNPWVSIDPILSVPGVREVVAARPAVAVSPLIQGKAIKGPAAKMYFELGIEPSALAVAQHYRPILSGFVLDSSDQMQADEISRWGIITLATDILMPGVEERGRLANDVLAFCEKIITRRQKVQ